MGIIETIREYLLRKHTYGGIKGITPTCIRLIEKGKEIEYKFANLQHIGNREHQEDSFGFSDISDAKTISEKGFMAVLADGMGGMLHGKLVSNMVVEEMLRGYGGIQLSRSIGIQLEELIEQVNRVICQEVDMEGGSTLASVYIVGQNLYWGSVGDSHIYLKRNSKLYQINEDHSYLNNLYEKVIHEDLKEEEVVNDPQKMALTEYIGKNSVLKKDISVRPLKLRRGDKIFICSDGVYGSVTHEELNALLELEVGICCGEILSKVLDKGLSYQDNLTGLIIVME